MHELQRQNLMVYPLHDEILTTLTYHRRPMKFRARIFSNEPMTIVDRFGRRESWAVDHQRH